ncbi:MAG: hypothetical protein ACHQJ6_03310, partial [Candidatus Berkiellales bacterium]
MRQFILCFSICLLILLLSCSSTNQNNLLPSSTQRIVDRAETAGFKTITINAPPFHLTSYEKSPPTPNALMRVYIEGDGNSWRTKTQLSNNPTPKHPLALELAISDPHPQVIYIARPCQYTPLTLEPACDPKYWSSHRYAAEVIHAYNTALDHLKEKAKNTNFILIGFSGGASVAALLA